MSTNTAFLRFWLSDGCRDAFLSQVEREDLPNLRLACHDFSSRAAPVLFEEISVTFKATSFTRPARMAALERIGHHVRTFTFNMPHTADTFLPPLIDPTTGEEEEFVYTPQVNKPSTLAGKVRQPKYGSWEVTDLLIKQYPPLFHAATNISAFVRVFSTLPYLSHLLISCPDQEPAQRYRRSVVDYALISLRIAIEQTSLAFLDTLSFLPIHPAGLFYLQPLHGFGATPRSPKTWARIRKLAVHIDSFPFDRPSRMEHLKLIHGYLGTLSPSLTRLFFRWKGHKGPSPLTLDQEPTLQPSSHHIHHHQRPESRSLLRPLQFPHLHTVELENAITDSSQINTFIYRHRHTLTDVNFEDITLRSGDWDDALAPLSRIAGGDGWKAAQEEVMDVPVVLSPVDGDETCAGRRLFGEVGEMEEGKGGSGMGLGRWLSRGRSSAAAKKAKEQFWGSGEHMKRFLRASVFTWR